jgi:hypothetical protein
MTTPKPKSCPLCGGEADVLWKWRGLSIPTHPVCRVMCRKCTGQGPDRMTVRGAIAAWNRRYPVKGKERKDNA